MNTSDVLFVAGDVTHLASIKIRCEQIAARLGCRAVYNVRRADDIPLGYRAFVCVKPKLPPEELVILSRRGRVIWDILDDRPPISGVDGFIASTRHAARAVGVPGPVEIIPHHHCNFERVPSAGDSLVAAYVGAVHWYPEYRDIPHRAHFVDRASREAVAGLYRSVGIGLNHRRGGTVSRDYLTDSDDTLPDREMHVKLNSGLKLINCIGFGIPSVSPKEPAYEELAPECTLFADFDESAEAVARLRADLTLYADYRRRCLERADEFHVDRVVRRYREFIERL